MKTIRRNLHPEVRVLDEKSGIAEYIASDETLDSYNEIIRAAGWRHNVCAKNFPFVDSHDYSTIERCLGKVIDYGLRAKRLLNTVQFAIDVEENRLARLAWKMTVAKMLPAVSVGFQPVKMVSKWDSDQRQFLAQLTDLNLPNGSDVRCIYIEQEQIELSLCVIGANPNAVAKAYKAGVMTDAELEMISRECVAREPAASADDPGDVEAAQRQAQTRKLEQLRRIAAKL